MLNLFERNRNELSRYFYDLSKASIVTSVLIPVFQQSIRVKIMLAGAIMTMLFLALGMLLRKDSGC